MAPRTLASTAPRRLRGMRVEPGGRSRRSICMRTSALRLILIDEDMLFAATLAEMLRDAGYRITGVATSWASAARLAAESPPEIARAHAAQFPAPRDPPRPHTV